MRRGGPAVALLLAVAAPLAAHDLFFRPRPFRIAPGTALEVRVLSGSFSRSENAIERARLADFSLVTPLGRQALDPASWSEGEPESRVRLSLDAPGTYVVGAALHPRPLALPAREFNTYLAEEGIESILAARRRQGTLAVPSKERYAKFLKSVVQVGEEHTGGFSAVLGYAAEIVPVEDPTTLAAGTTLHVRCLVAGQPLPGAIVFAGGRRAGTEKRFPRQRIKTDAQGIAAVRIEGRGDWYVKFVHMTEVGEPDVTYDSKWSTLTFGVF